MGKEVPSTTTPDACEERAVEEFANGVERVPH